MARITAVTTDFFRVPLATALGDATHGTMSSFELNTVRVHDADGAQGVGYTYTIGHNGAAISALLNVDLPQILLGADADPIESLWQKMWNAMHYGGRGGPVVLAMSAVDIALWDLKGKRAGLPLYKLLGGFDPKVPCYAGGVDLNLEIEPLLEQTRANLEHGFRAIKMKVGRARLAEDVARVAAMREFLGEDFPLMVDANMKWTVEEAIRAARALRPFGLVWLEEPLIPEDIEGHRRVLREGGLPLAAGENLRSLWEFKQLIQAGGVSFPEPDVTNVGGVTSFMKVAHLAEAFHLPCTSHGAHDITVQLLAAIPNRSFLEVHAYALDRYLEEPLQIEQGFARASERAGHGLNFDWERLEGHRV